MPSAVCVRSFVPKLKNSALLRDFVGGERAARDFDHGADQVIEFHLLLRHHFLRDAMDDLGLEIEFLLEPDERDHDFRLHLDLLLRDFGRGFEDGAGLHLGDLRIGDAEAAAAMAEHRIELVQLRDALLRSSPTLMPSLLARDPAAAPWSCGRNSCSGGSRKRIVAGIAFERLEDADEILALIGQQLRERLFPVVDVVGENHLAHRVDAVAFEEHVLGAGEADAGGAEGEGVLGLLGIVGVGADIEARGLRAPLHELVERLELLGLLRGFVAVRACR